MPPLWEVVDDNWQAKERAVDDVNNPVVPLDAVRRPYRNNSYLTALTIVRENDRNVLGKRRVELNEMTGDVELARQPLKDIDTATIRAEIERVFSVGKSEDGLKLSPTDVETAIRQVASEHPYHPVREYLNFQTWDGVPRIASVVEDILNGEKSEISNMLMRRFFIGAVARAFEPGCKVDTVLILVGSQGALKSSFFRVLASPWFVDTVIDISSDATRAYMTMRKAWILEWAELESLFRARDAASVKAFLSSASDTYVPKYGRNSVEVKRHGVIVGTINPDEFLTDDTGARRFWPIKAGDIDLRIAEEQKDQLWAEAVVAYRAGESWWLTREEEAGLVAAHEEHRVRDAWEEKIAGWLGLTGTFTTGDVLSGPLGKPPGQWTRGDEMRVAKSLKALGFYRKTDPDLKTRKVWAKR